MDNGIGTDEIFDRRFVVANGSDELEQMQRTLLTVVESMAYDATSTFAIRLALEEALSNAFKHGNKDQPGTTVTVACRIGPQAVRIEVEDQGPGFDPLSVPDPTVEENIEIPSGRGLVLMRAFMTEVEIPPPGNRVRLTFVRPTG
jgi:serine/threonine-protein kinase RsbW